MNAQRSVWSLPPPTVQQKYEIYFGGTIDDPWRTDNPLIRLWWTDAEMKRLAYRELRMPAGLLQLLRRYDRPPPLASVTQDNIALFLSVLGIGEEIKALYVVCDPRQVLRYGIVTLPPEVPSWVPRDHGAHDPGSWTWDGDTVWPLYRAQREVATQVTGYFVYACRIDTRTNTADSLKQVFEGYYRLVPGENVEHGSEWYFCQGAGWVATDPHAPRSVLANILYFFEDPEYPFSRIDYTVQSTYLPSGPSPILISGTTRENTLPAADLNMLGTFPVGPAGLVRFAVWSREPESFYGTLCIVVDDRVALQIPETYSRRNGYLYDYYHMTTTGLPYNLAVPLYANHRLLRCSGDRALVLLRRTWFVTEEGHGDTILDALIEFDLKSGRATKDIVVPTIRPEWGMEYNGVTLAVPMRTSSTGRVRLP
jgi:hypothetical protein